MREVNTVAREKPYINFLGILGLQLGIQQQQPGGMINMGNENWSLGF